MSWAQVPVTSLPADRARRWIGAAGWRGCEVGPEVVFGEVERAGDRGAVTGIRGGGPGDPALDGLGVDADDLGELLGGQSGLPQRVFEVRVRHFSALTALAVKGCVCRDF